MLSKKLRVYSKVLQKIKSAKKIAVISHRAPDWDTLGSWTAFYSAIKDNFNFKKIDLICKDKIPDKYSFIPNIKKYSNNLIVNKYDLIIFVDSWSKDQTLLEKDFPSLFDKQTYNTINIDHHITNEIYGKQNIIITSYASTTMIIYEFLKLNNLKISKDTATSLLTWIYTDTWWLKHSNTTSWVYRVVKDLINLGWNRENIINNFFKNNTLNNIKLWWKIIDKAFKSNDDILYTYIDKSLLSSHNAEANDVYGIIDTLNSVEKIKYACILTEIWEYVKWSLRTLREDVDLTKIAWKYWWWWHKKASWFTIKWNIEENKFINF